MGVLAKLAVKIVGDTEQYERDLNQADQKTDKFAGGIENLGSKVLGIGLVGALLLAGNAVKQFISDSISQFTDFEDSINEVFTLMPGMSEQAMTEMEMDVLAFGSELGRLSEEVVPAVYQSISAGVPRENVFDFMHIAADAALGGVTDLETAVDGLTSAVNAYGEENLDAQMASDLLFTAVKGGKTTFKELSDRLFQVTPIAASLGVEFGNITAALSAMTAQGVPTRVAATQLRQVLIELSKTGGAAADTFEQLAGKTFVKFIEEGNNLQDALVLMEEAAAENDLRISDMFGSIEAGNAALALTGQGTQKFTDELINAEEAQGATAEAAEVMNTSLVRQEERVEALREEYQTLTGKGLAPARAMFLSLQEAVLESQVGHLRQREVLTLVADSIDEYGVLITDSYKELRKLTQEVKGYNTEQAREKAMKMAVTRTTWDYLSATFSLEKQLVRLEIAQELQKAGWKGNVEELRTLLDVYDDLDPELRAELLAELTENITMQTAAIVEGVKAARELSQEEEKLTRIEEDLAVAVMETTASYEPYMETLAGAGTAVEHQRIRADNLRISEGKLAIQAEETALVEEEAARVAEEEARVRKELNEEIQKQIDHLVQLNSVMGGYAVAALESAETSNLYWEQINEWSDPILSATVNQESLNKTLFDSVNAAGGSALQMVLLGDALGLYDEAALESALKTALIKAEIDRLSAAYVSGEMSISQVRSTLSGFVFDLETAEQKSKDAAEGMGTLGEESATATENLSEMDLRLTGKLDELDSQMRTVSDGGGETFQALVDAANTHMPEVFTTVDGVLGEIETTFETGTKNIEDSYDELMVELKTGTTTGFKAIDIEYNLGLTKTTNTLDGYRSEFEGVGENLSLGIAAGIRAGIEEIARAAADVVIAAIAAADRAAGNSSPSREMMNRGGWFSEGYAIGIHEMAPVVNQAVEQMVEGAMNSTRPGVFNLSSQVEDVERGVDNTGNIPQESPATFGDVYITIETQEGDSPEDIATAVSEELASRSRLNRSAGV